MTSKTDLKEKSHVPQAEDLPSKREWIFIVLFVIICFIGAHWVFASCIKEM